MSVLGVEVLYDCFQELEDISGGYASHNLHPKEVLDRFIHILLDEVMLFHVAVDLGETLNCNYLEYSCQDFYLFQLKVQLQYYLALNPILLYIIYGTIICSNFSQHEEMVETILSEVKLELRLIVLGDD